jgi:hypothetical protein
VDNKSGTIFPHIANKKKAFLIIAAVGLLFASIIAYNVLHGRKVKEPGYIVSPYGLFQQDAQGNLYKMS